MLNKIFPFNLQAQTPTIESLKVSDQLKALLYDIIKYGAQGASTLDLHAEHHGNIPSKVKRLIAAGAIIHTIKKDITDKRGALRRKVAHRIFVGFDSSITGI